MTNKLFSDDDDLVDNDVEIVIPEDEPLKPFLDKYHDVKGVAKAIVEKESFIKQLKRENAELRADVVGRSRVEEVVDRLLAQRTQTTTGNSEATNASGEDGAGNSSTNTNTGLTEADVQRILAQERSAQRTEQNVVAVKGKLQEMFGNDWQRVLIAKAKEIGESTEFFDALAKSNPNALIALVSNSKKEEKKQDSALFTQGINTTGQTLNQNTQNVRNKSFYDKLKQTNPKDYWTPRVQNQMHKDALAQGALFFN